MGAPIRVTTPDGKYVNVVGEVLEFDPPHRKFIVNNIKRIVEKGDVSFFVRCVYGMFKLLTPLMAPKKSRAENWN